MIEPHYPREDFVAQELLWLLLLLPFKGVPWRHFVVDFRLGTCGSERHLVQKLGACGFVEFLWFFSGASQLCPSIFCLFVDTCNLCSCDHKKLNTWRRGAQKQLNQLRRKWPLSPATSKERRLVIGPAHWHPGWGTWPWGAILTPTPSWSLVYVRTLSAAGCWSPLESWMTHIGNPGVTDWTWQGYVIPLMMREVSGVLTIRDIPRCSWSGNVFPSLGQDFWDNLTTEFLQRHRNTRQIALFWFKFCMIFLQAFGEPHGIPSTDPDGEIDRERAPRFLRIVKYAPSTKSTAPAQTIGAQQ